LARVTLLVWRLLKGRVTTFVRRERISAATRQRYRARENIVKNDAGTC